MNIGAVDRGVIDSHLHLDDRDSDSAAEAVSRLKKEMVEAGVAHAFVLHLLGQRWSMVEFAEAVNASPDLTGFVNIDPAASTALRDIDHAPKLGFRGLKLHPRRQQFHPCDANCVALVERAGNLGLPVIIDCFPDGTWLMAGLSVLQYAELAKRTPDARIVVAHAAGHHCLDLMMLMKRVPNLWLDLSYSLLYYGDSVIDSLFYCIKSMRYERVLFGTDYPDRGLKLSVARSLDLFDRFGVTGEARDKVLWKNAQQLLFAPSA